MVISDGADVREGGKCPVTHSWWVAAGAVGTLDGRATMLLDAATDLSSVADISRLYERRRRHRRRR